MDLIGTKQPTITDNSISLSHVSRLGGILASKQPLLSKESSLALGALTAGELSVNGSITLGELDLVQALNGKQHVFSTTGGAGSSLLEGNQIRQLYGHDGIDIATNFNLVDPNKDPEHCTYGSQGKSCKARLR